MRYKVELIYKDNTFDIICFNIYRNVVTLVRNARRFNDYKDIRVYMLVGQYKNEDMEIQHNN